MGEEENEDMIAAKVHGDTFVIALKQTGVDGATIVLDRIAEELSKLDTSKYGGPLRASYGLCEITEAQILESENPDDLVRSTFEKLDKTQIAAKQAKNKYRNPIAYWDDVAGNGIVLEREDPNLLFHENSTPLPGY